MPITHILAKHVGRNFFRNHFFRLPPIQQFIILIDKSLAPDVFYGAKDVFLVLFQHNQFSSKFYRKSTTLENTLQFTYKYYSNIAEKSCWRATENDSTVFQFPLPSLNQKQKALFLNLSASVIISCTMILNGNYLIWSIPFCVLKVLNVRWSVVKSEWYYKFIIIKIHNLSE